MREKGRPRSPRRGPATPGPPTHLKSHLNHPPSPSATAPRLSALHCSHHGRNLGWGCSYVGPPPSGSPRSPHGAREGEKEVTWRCQQQTPPRCLRRFDFHHLLPCGMRRSGETKKDEVKGKKHPAQNCSGMGGLGVRAAKLSPTCLFQTCGELLRGEREGKRPRDRGTGAAIQGLPETQEKKKKKSLQNKEAVPYLKGRCRERQGGFGKVPGLWILPLSPYPSIQLEL